MPFLELKNISKSFGKVQALKNIELQVEKGEFLVILGPSGCGKSTLLRIIAGLEKPDRGDISIDNFEVTDVLPKDRDVAMVFQNYALYPHMNVFNNIAFSLKIRKSPEEKIQDEVERVSQFLEIKSLLERRPRELSGGQQQRVALARALVRKPKVFLMDEPLSNLDARLRETMRKELKSLQTRTGITTVYVTHDQVEAMAMGDNIAVLKEGSLQQIGSPYEIYNEPINLFVAEFVGSPPMNLMQTKEDFIIGFRPEDFSENRSTHSALSLRVTKRQIEFLGDESLLIGEPSEVKRLGPDGTRVLPVEKKELILKKRGTFGEESEISIFIPEKKLHFFDKNGYRISPV